MIRDFFKSNQIDFLEDASLTKYNTYKINTKCKFLVFPKNKYELIKILKKIKEEKMKYFILGNGSNIILSMEYYDGIVIKLDKMNQITYDGNIVIAEAGCSLIKLSMETINNSLSGLEFATGIPGSVGGSTVMNAGAYNSDMASVIKEVEIIDDNFQIRTLTNKELCFSYRDSLLKKNNMIVVSTTFILKKGDLKEMKYQVEKRRIKRQSSQPLDLPSAGSVFRNPENMHAGELIEKCNLKGCNRNGAEVSYKHANFIVNKGNATGQDIIFLISKIQKEVKKYYNVDLILEQIIVE